MSRFTTSSTIALDPSVPFSENQVKKRVKLWDIPYTCSNGTYLFRKDDWENKLDEKALQKASSRAKSRKTKAKASKPKAKAARAS